MQARRRIFVDCDGVLADFNKRWMSLFDFPTSHYYKLYGKEETWNMVRNIDPDFFLHLEVIPDAPDLINSIRHLNPVVLTGSPSEWGYRQKMRWADHHFHGLPTIVCKSKEKHFFAHEGDILIDDRVKYKHLWDEVNGLFVYHTSTYETIHELKCLSIL